MVVWFLICQCGDINLVRAFMQKELDMKAKAIFWRFLTAITTLFFLGIGVCLCEAQEADKRNSAMGELKLEGKYIERLDLRRKDGPMEKFNRPEETIKLPAGKYQVWEIHLKGGYSCYPRRSPKIDWITVGPEQSAVLKVGAPLKQTVKVQRRGKVLMLNYELLGTGGEKYTSGNRSKPPTFTVYKGDEKIASDKFEFG